jgi:hypothetical protein
VAITVKVVPGASRTAVVGLWGEALRLSVAAPPEAGKANAAVRKLIAATLNVKRGAVALVAGESRPLKRLAIRGLNVDQARAAIADVLRSRRGCE